ncbi:unnamed protein product, partial [Meganyctiphanes norvegica]
IFFHNRLSMALKNNGNPRYNREVEMPSEDVEDSEWNPKLINPSLSNAGQLSSDTDQWDNIKGRNADIVSTEFHNEAKQYLEDDESVHHEAEEALVNLNSSVSQKRQITDPNPTIINKELQNATEEIKRLKKEATDEIKKLRMEAEALREENLRLKMKKLAEEAEALREENKKLKQMRSTRPEQIHPKHPPPPTQNTNTWDIRHEQAFYQNQQSKQTNNQQQPRRYLREMGEVHHGGQNQNWNEGSNYNKTERDPHLNTAPAFYWLTNNKTEEKGKGFTEKFSSGDGGSQYDTPSTSTGTKYQSHDDRGFNNQFSSRYEEKREGGSQYGNFSFSNPLQGKDSSWQAHAKTSTQQSHNRPYNDYNESSQSQGSSGQGFDQWGYHQNHSMSSSTSYHGNMQNPNISQSSWPKRDTWGLDSQASNTTTQRGPYF